MSIDLNKLSIDDLQKLQEEAALMVEKKREQAIDEAREKVNAIAAELGMSVEELMGLGGGRKTRGAAKKASRPVSAKYINKDGQTWSGRGRKPLWLQDALNKGKKLSDFEI